MIVTVSKKFSKKREIVSHFVLFTQRLAATMDLEARQLIAEAYRRTEECLSTHKDKLEALSELLLQKETLNYEDVEQLLGE